MYALDNKYPINNAGEVKTAAAYFDKYLSRFSAANRALIASHLEKQASEFHVDLNMPWITNYSRCLKGGGYSPDFERNMTMRKHACETGKVVIKVGDEVVPAAMLTEKLIAKKDSLSPVAMMSALEHLDKTAGLTGLYDSRIMDPVFTVFGSLSNPEFDAVKLAEGITDYGIKKFACLDDSQVRIEESLGKQVAAEFMKDPVETFNKLADIERSALAEIIRS